MGEEEEPADKMEGGKVVESKQKSISWQPKRALVKNDSS